MFVFLKKKEKVQKLKHMKKIMLMRRAFSAAIKTTSLSSFRRIQTQQQSRLFGSEKELNNFHSSPDPTSSFKLDDELFKLDELKSSVEAPESKLNAAKIGKVSQHGRTRRWYKEADVKKHRYGTNDLWAVTLDGRFIKTPRDSYFLLPTEKLANLIASEWANQDGTIRPVTMPMMTIATTAIDLIPEKRSKSIDGIMSYIKTDVVCCRHDSDKNLQFLQSRMYDPLLRWFSDEFRLPPLIAHTDIFPPKQPEQTLTTVQWKLFHMDEWNLAGFDFLVHNLKSFVLASALWLRKIDLDTAISASRMEEIYQMEQWGKVPVHDIDIVQNNVKTSAATVFLRACPPPKDFPGKT